MNRTAKTAVACGAVMCVPMVYYLYLDMRYDVSSFSAEDKLVLAVENDNISAAKKLLKSGADPEIRSRYGISAVYRAADNANTELLIMFVENGIDPNYTCGEDITLLGIACRNQDNEAVRCLLEAGADPDYSAGNCVPAIHYAAAYDKDYNYELVEMLILAGADPSSQSVSDGKIMLPYRYYYDEMKNDEDITDDDAESFAKIKDMLYRPYIEWLKVKLESEN